MNYILHLAWPTLEGTSLAFDKAGMLGQLYQSLILYPKGLSQIAKQFMPVAHVRNFVSAGAFATANGIIPDAAAIKQAYQALQTPSKAQDNRMIYTKSY